MTKQPNAIPLRPDYRAAAPTPNHLLRAAFAAAKAKAVHRPADEVIRQLFPNDDVSPQLLMETRATVAAGTTTASGNASQLVQNSIGIFLAALGNTGSAASQIMARGVQLRMGEFSTITFPYRSTTALTPASVSELNPIPVRQDALAGVPLGPPHKMGAIAVMTRDLLKRSDADVIFSTLLSEDASLGFDAAAFSSEDGNGDAIKGLLNGATSVAGGAGLLSDLRNLAAAVAAGGSGEVIFVGGPSFAAAVGLDANIKATVLPSLAVPETRLIAVDPQSIVWGAGLDPSIDASTEAILHMSDSPLPISASGVADPVRGLWQTDSVALRMILPVVFAKRRAAAVAYIDNLSTAW